MIEELPSNIAYIILKTLLDINIHSNNNIKSLHFYLLILKLLNENKEIFNLIT